MNWGREDLCLMINGQENRDYCLAIVKEDVEFCKKLNQSTACIALIAELAHDTSLCNYADDQELCLEHVKKMH